MQCVSFVLWLLIFFFFKQKTAYEMRISDWSSDVCSSDLTVWGRGRWQVTGMLAAARCRWISAPYRYVSECCNFRSAPGRDVIMAGEWRCQDRKSTRLNSSH